MDRYKMLDEHAEDDELGASPVTPDAWHRPLNYEVEAQPDGTYWVVQAHTRVMAILDGVGQIGLDEQAACTAVAVLEVTGATGPSELSARLSEHCDTTKVEARADAPAALSIGAVATRTVLAGAALVARLSLPGTALE